MRSDYQKNLKKVLTSDVLFDIITMLLLNSRRMEYGGIAQLARALGSYPGCRWFKSYSRYHFSKHIRPGGQAAKTPPFHGGNTSSILVRVTTAILNKAPEKSSFLGALAFANSCVNNLIKLISWAVLLLSSIALFLFFQF